MDAFTQKGMVSFLAWTIAGFACFALAWVVARRVTASPRQAYWLRLVLMLLCVIGWWGLFFPAIIPTRNEQVYYLSPRTVAAQYGMHTIWVWCVAAALGWPKGTKGKNGC